MGGEWNDEVNECGMFVVGYKRSRWGGGPKTELGVALRIAVCPNRVPCSEQCRVWYICGIREASMEGKVTFTHSGQLVGRNACSGNDAP